LADGVFGLEDRKSEDFGFPEFGIVVGEGANLKAGPGKSRGNVFAEVTGAEEDDGFTERGCEPVKGFAFSGEHLIARFGVDARKELV
jgi:hypothetical protein